MKQLWAAGLTMALLVPAVTASAEHERQQNRRDPRPPILGQRVVYPHQSPAARRAETALVTRARRLEQDMLRARSRGRLDFYTADRLLDDVRWVMRFLANDRYLSQAEFDRRDSDLRWVERQFEEALLHHRGHRHNGGRCVQDHGHGYGRDGRDGRFSRGPWRLMPLLRR